MHGESSSHSYHKKFQLSTTSLVSTAKSQTLKLVFLENVILQLLLFKNLRQYLCEYCTKPFIRKDHLLRHKREVHKWEVRFACKKCKKNFKRKQHLDRHKQACCCCQMCRAEFKSPEEKKSHACEPAKKKKTNRE